VTRVEDRHGTDHRSNPRHGRAQGPAPGADEAVRVRGAVKTFGGHRALDGLDLSVATGEVHGLLGPNGAGKSTTLRVLLGLLRRDAGTVHVLGADPWRESTAVHRRVAYVPGDVTLWPQLSGGEVLDLLGRLHGGIDPARRRSLVERFDLDPSRRCRTYSRGNRQKVVLVAAFAVRSDLLLLDEPTAGLDPLMEAEFQRLVREVRAEGRTVLLSSHLLSEVEALCDRVSIIRAGRVVESGALADLRHLARVSVTAQVRDPRPLDRLRERADVHDVSIEGDVLRATVDPGALDAVVSLLAGAHLISLTTRPPSLEELFLQHYSPAEGGSR
jgi:ABC-2 type transport system ATP-binding protein